MGEKIDGKSLAQKYRNELKKNISEDIGFGKRPPCLATIVVGSDGGSMYYIKNQNKLCGELGIEYKNILLEDSVEEEHLIEIIEKLNNDTSVDGIMLQLPLPEKISEKKVTAAISPLKDVDGLTEINTGKFYKGSKCFVPCTPRSALELIKSTGVNLNGKNAVVVGRSNIVGKPITQLLIAENCTVTVCHSKTVGLDEWCRKADILVSAIGKPGFIKSNFVKEGAIVIDIGTTSVEGKITGDVLYDDVIKIASYLTPVPGGVGAMTTTLLMKNIYEAYKDNAY